jgi:erythromycin esterase
MWMNAPVVEIVGDEVGTTGAALPGIPSPNDPSKLTPAQRIIALDELRKASTQLVTVDPTAPLTDLQPFELAVGDARLVGLGEASHGTSEFFDMKDRLFRDLVAKKNFTVFAIEANQPEAREMDEYVTKGTGDPAHALKSMYFWTWQTVEVLNLAKWMRSYNASPGRHPTLHFAGFDMQTPDEAVSLVTQFAKSHDAEAGVAVERAYACIPHRSDQNAKMSKEDETTCYASIQTVRGIIQKLGPDAEIEHDVRIVEQGAEMNLTPDARPGEVRDKAMAENVEWLLNVKYPTAKLVLWAHNYHISNLGRADRPSMGTWLKDRHGKDFYRLGFAFDHGTIRAFRPQHGLDIQTVPAALPNSVEAMLREDGSLVFVNLRDLPQGVLLDWLNGAVWQREVGAVWDPSYADNYYTTVKLAQRFDGLIFVAESHATQAIANQ